MKRFTCIYSNDICLFSCSNAILFIVILVTHTHIVVYTFQGISYIISCWNIGKFYVSFEMSFYTRLNKLYYLGTSTILNTKCMSVVIIQVIEK